MGLFQRTVKLKDKVALITGGGRGIGKAVALAYCREGAKLAICARTGPEIEEVAKEITALGAECLAVVCDVSLEESVAKAVQEVQEKFGKIDVLINNAGVMTRPAPLAELEVRKWGSRPDSVTEVFVFLATDESRRITGKMLSSSGWKREIKS